MDKSNKKRRRKTPVKWSLEAEMLLITIWREKIRELRGTHKKWLVYLDMEEEMQKLYYDFSASEIRHKIKNLTKKYRLEKQADPGGSPSDWVHYQVIHDLLDTEHPLIQKNTDKSTDSNQRLSSLDDSNIFEQNTHAKVSKTEFVEMSSPFETLDEDQSMSSSDSSIPIMSKRSRRSVASKTMAQQLEESTKIRGQSKNKNLKFLSDLMKTATETPPPDHIDLFLQSLGQTLRTFPEMDIADVKLEMLKIVTERQRKLLTSIEPPSTTTVSFFDSLPT